MQKIVVTSDGVRLQIQPDMKVATAMEVLHGKLTENTKVWLLLHAASVSFRQVQAILRSKRTPTAHVSSEDSFRLMLSGSRDRKQKAEEAIIYDRRVSA